MRRYLFNPSLSFLNLKFVAILALTGLLMPAHAATSNSVVQVLRAKLERHSEVGVIVTFEAMGSVTTAKTSFAKQAFSSRLITAQQALLDELPSVDKRRARSYQFAPQMAMRVNRQALEQLLANPEVNVAYDKPYKLLLAESVPRVFPDQLTSPYDGGNQWAVAVLDSGVDKTHSFLTNKVVAEGCFSNRGGAGVPDEASASTCPSGAAVETGMGTGIACDTSLAGCDHGTRVAGVAAGSAASFNGVARAGKIISIQVTTEINGLVPGVVNDLCEAAYGSVDPCVLAFSSDIIAALDYVYSIRGLHNIAAVNLSLGYGGQAGACDSEPEKTSIDNLKSAGIATVVAAGNDGSLFDMAIPACVSTAIAVGSTLDSADSVSSFSNSSVELDFYAPGETINSSVPADLFSDFAGTSMAAPHVAGAWAVLKHAKPSASVDELETLLDNHGPLVLKPGADMSHTQRRLALTDALATLCVDDGCTPVDDEMCIPVKAENGNVALICL